MYGTLADVIIQRGCPELERLVAVRSKGWKEEKLDQTFARQRHVSDNAEDKRNRDWYKRLNAVMEEIDGYSLCVPVMGSPKFLDLGCCPGGFASYILQRNRLATGVGVSLPVERGGHKFGLQERLRSRFQIHFADITSFQQLSPFFIDHPRLSPAPPQMRPASFDLVLLDGHQLRTDTSDYAAPWDMDRLLISQLILALQSVRTGGSIVFTLAHPERILTAKILYLLHVLSGDVIAIKPRTMHMTRGIFYAVALGVGKGAKGRQMPEMIRGLQDIWAATTFGGEEGKGRFIEGSELDFIIATEELETSHLDWLISVGQPIWDVQAQWLDKWFRSKGVV
ncbi:hypothetical protein OE88DRAFT_1646448 [Heliocybe sulcata]|uniref:Ribosomal RNA methyltransferase FtsJ domain-containing protein n=1 Tax=Heliocybe sulcata TaxID=5364 RepID=A0A5C3MX31_9AGAM|nr:hypothetical protein OE88DRAFT_1646448 [Heliocybe sulcata]